MPTSNSNPQIPMLIIFVMISLLVLGHHNVRSEYSFRFPSFRPYTAGITLEGDAFASSDAALHLTSTVPRSAGRASFAEPVRLWDAKTGELAGFTTTFSFVVGPATATGPTRLFGDGISFFMAPFRSCIPRNSSGGFLGLFAPETAMNVFKNQVVAVEFDTFGNPWDPPSKHMGIDINSVASAATVALPGANLESGLTAFATVKYEPVTKNLSVLLEYPRSVVVNGTTTSLSFAVDLRTVLPEWVRVGFSGATGQLVELHKILSWTFSSSFY